MRKAQSLIYTFTTFLISAILLFSCKKERDMPMEEIAAASLVCKFSFDDDFKESGSGNTGTGSGTLFIPGVRGKAYEGSTNGKISFAAAPADFSSIRSFTVSLWIRTDKHAGGQQALFTIPNTNSHLGNLVVMIDQNTTVSDSMNMKIYFEKNVTPAIGWYGQFIDLYGDFRLPDMYGKWKHVVFSYDATTSKFGAYLDGQAALLDEGIMTRFTYDPNDGGMPLGSLSFTNISGFIIGGFQNHLGAPWNEPEQGMLNYTGAMDEFRIYDKALTAAEVDALYRYDRRL